MPFPVFILMTRSPSLRRSYHSSKTSRCTSRRYSYLDDRAGNAAKMSRGWTSVSAADGPVSLPKSSPGTGFLLSFVACLQQNVRARSSCRGTRKAGLARLLRGPRCSPWNASRSRRRGKAPAIPARSRPSSSGWRNVVRSGQPKVASDTSRSSDGRCRNLHPRKTSTLIPAATRGPRLHPHLRSRISVQFRGRWATNSQVSEASDRLPPDHEPRHPREFGCQAPTSDGGVFPVAPGGGLVVAVRVLRYPCRMPTRPDRPRRGS